MNPSTVGSTMIFAPGVKRGLLYSLLHWRAGCLRLVMSLSLCSTTTEDWVRNGTLKGETFQRGAKPTQWQYRTHRRPVGCCQWGVFDGAAGESALSMDVVDSNTLPHFHARCVRITSNKSDMVMRMIWDTRVVVVEGNDERGNRGNSILPAVTRRGQVQIG